MSSTPRFAALLRRLRTHLSRLRPRASSGDPSSSRKKPKSAAELPGPSLFTSLFWFFVQGYGDKSHLLQQMQRRLYGPIWRSRFGKLELVNVACPELIAQVLRQEGRYPVRAQLLHWKDYRDLRGHAYGLHVSSGADWYRMRSALNPRLLKLQEVRSYAGIVHQVVDDLLLRVQVLRSRSHDRSSVSDVASELYKFGFEGMAAVLFETRLGCLRDDVPEQTLRFIGAVDDMLTLSEQLLVLPRWSRHVLPLWRRFVHAWDVLHDTTRVLIEQRVCDLMNGVDHTDGLFLTHLLSCDQLSRDEVYVCVSELLLGGVDTTSNTLAWTLYHLSRDKCVQERLHAEVTFVCPGSRPPTPADLHRMPYLKAVIKETLRLYPVVPGNGRLVTDREVLLDGVQFPRETQFHLCHYAVCQDDAQFVDPQSFVPERWLRPPGVGTFRHHPFSFIPFGVGVRGCVGKRLAEMEMYFALSRLIQLYQLQPMDGETVEPKTRTLLVPSIPINLRFLSRDSDAVRGGGHVCSLP